MEILVEVKTNQAKEVAKLVSESMIKGFNFYAPNVPMTVNPEIAKHWVH